MSLRARGFALPMVVLLAMVGAIMAAVMLERQAAQQLSVNRQLVRYNVHHAGRGVKEVVGTWLNTVQNEPVENLASKSGHALDLEIKDGRVISIYLVEGQGTVLGDFSGLEGVKASAVAGTLDRLRAAVGAERMGEFVRPAGPVTVSANTAAEEVLAAVAGGVLGVSEAQSYAEFLVRERRDGKLMAGKLTAAANQAGATAEQKAKLAELVTDKPTLFQLRAEVRGPDRGQSGQVFIMGATKLLDRYAGLVLLEGKQTGRGSGTNQNDLLQPLGAFLTWEHDPPKDAEGEE